MPERPAPVRRGPAWQPAVADRLGDGLVRPAVDVVQDRTEQVAFGVRRRAPAAPRAVLALPFGGLVLSELSPEVLLFWGGEVKVLAEQPSSVAGGRHGALLQAGDRPGRRPGARVGLTT